MLAPLWLACVLGQSTGPQYQPGVTLRLFQLPLGNHATLPVLKEGQSPNVDEVRPLIDWRTTEFSGVHPPFVSEVRARLKVPGEGDYAFRLTSDDGAVLRLDSAVLVDNGGQHGKVAKESPTVHLTGGGHPLEITHFDQGGDRALMLEWRTPGTTAFVLVPNACLETEIDNARVTSPGFKSLADARRPGDGAPVGGVHPSFKLDTIRVNGFDPMIGCMAFEAAGRQRLVVGTFSPLQRDDVTLPDIDSKKPDRLYALSGVTGNPGDVTVTPCADGLYEPLGLCAVGDALYVSHRRAITRLLDMDGDGFYETHEDVASGWGAWNYHQFTFGLVHLPDTEHGGPGWLYATLSTAMAPPKWEGMGTNAAPNDPLRGTAIEVDVASNTFRAIAGGLRAPNGIGWGPRGPDGVPALFYCDNQGTWMPSNHMGEIVIDGGRFFGHYNNTNFVPNLAERFPRGGVASSWCDRVRARPALDLVYGDLCNSPTQPLLIETGPYRNQVLIGELTAGGVRRACMEQVNGQWQGAVFQFSQGFDVGINRMAWGPGGTLFVGGIGAGGNWNWKGTRSGLHRLTPTGELPFEMSAVRAMPDGFDVQFTREIDTAWLANTANYTVKQWTYEPTDQYGGEKKQVEPLTVTEARPAGNGRRVFLKVPGLKPERTVLIRTDPVSTGGERIWTTEALYTLNCIPKVWSSGPPFPEPFDLGAAPPRDAVVLIGRAARAAFRTPKETAQDIEKGRSQDEMTGKKWEGFVDVSGGDLVSRASFGDCRLHFEWLTPPGGAGQLAGNSGVYLQDRYEVQVLGTPAAKPGDPPLASDDAGSIYKVRAPDVNASKGPGEWQAYDILFTAPRFNAGVKVSNARITLYWNGVLVHRAVEVPGPTGAAVAKGETGEGRSDGVQIGPIRLQAHASAAQGPVRFRNVWVAPLDHGERAGPAVHHGWGPWTTLVPLPPGTSLDDAFVVRGGSATFQIDKGQLVGTTAENADPANTFLVTRARFTDFDLVADVKTDAELNSGIQVRSDIDGRGPGTPLESGPRDGRVRGYQVEIDPGSRAFSAGIYDEARRGWLYPLTDNPAARSSFKGGEWNRIEVRCRGERIQTWVNGVPAADLFDAMDAGGHVAFQVHGAGDRKEPLRVRFKDVRVREWK